MSPNIPKGARWSAEIARRLETTSVGILCVTRDNLNSPWLLFEAGALAKSERAKVCTFLLDLTSEDVEMPLAQFQHTTPKRDEVFALLTSLNDEVGKLGGHSLSEMRLRESFDAAWPELARALNNILRHRPKLPWYFAMLHHVSLPVRDLEASRHFYRDVLGLREIVRPQYVPFEGAWFLLPSGQHLHLLQNDTGTFRKRGKNITLREIRDCHFALRVTDVVAARDYLRERGCEVKGADADQLLPRYPAYYVLDPDGHVIELNERNPKRKDPPYLPIRRNPRPNFGVKLSRPGTGPAAELPTSSPA